jgi:tetratricopeptide (TPR) repeat protein
LANRGWQHYLQKANRLFLLDTDAALQKRADLPYAAFNLGLALLACGRNEEAAAAYTQTARAFPESVRSLALPDLVEAESSWLSQERAAAIRDLLLKASTEPLSTPEHPDT